MKILRESSCLSDKKAVATIGFFDGVHCGHRFLLSQVESMARSRGCVSMAVTFERHPADVLNPGTVKPLLTTFDERCALLEKAGVDYCAVIDFTPELSRLSAMDFMKEYLVKRFNVATLIVGYDHSFGHDKGSTFDDYRREGEQVGLEVVQAGKFTAPGGLKVSSTQIRHRLTEGNVEAAALMLGRCYSLGGAVVEGHRVGRRIGFPTANIDAFSSHKIIPARGVYACVAHVGGAAYAAVVNIGTRPTVHNGNDTSVEAYLIGFSGDIYGSMLEVEFVSRLRDERQFQSLDELRAQIDLDAHKAADVLKDRLS